MLETHTNAILSGLAIALVAGPIGCFIVWRRLAYFGETLTHGALLGVGLGILFHFNIVFGAVASAFAIALMLTGLKRQRKLSEDTLLGVLSNTALSIGLVTGAIEEHLDVLFGDVGNVTGFDVIILWVGAIFATIAILYMWRDLIAISVHEDLARAEGVKVVWVELAFMLVMAGMTALAMKVVGLLLITALTVIPAAAARRLASTPETMALTASIFAAIAVGIGMLISAQWTLMAGPTMVLCASFIFVLTLGIKQSN
jgi:zinc transport system permease protein